jgi:hypothetical protein
MDTNCLVLSRTAHLWQSLRAAAITAVMLIGVTLTIAASCAAPAYATVSGSEGPIAYLDGHGDIAAVDPNGAGQHVLVPASALPGYELSVAGSGAWSSGSDPELLFLAQSTMTCIDTGCPATPQVRLYEVPESGGKPQLLVENVGYIQSASWYGTSTGEIILSAENQSTNQSGYQVFVLDEVAATSPERSRILGVQGFDVDATRSDGYIVFADGNENLRPAASASPDGPWEGCTKLPAAHRYLPVQAQRHHYHVRSAERHLRLRPHRRSGERRADVRVGARRLPVRHLVHGADLRRLAAAPAGRVERAEHPLGLVAQGPADRPIGKRGADRLQRERAELGRACHRLGSRPSRLDSPTPRVTQSYATREA